jgi:hypothetical protein
VTPDEALEILDRILPTFDPPIDRLNGDAVVVVGLGFRGIEIHRAADELAPRFGNASMVLLRSLADLLILVRWFEVCPRLHIRLWMAQDERDEFREADAIRGTLARRGVAVPDPVDPKVRNTAERRFRHLRSLAVKRGIRPARDSLLPSVRMRADSLPELQSDVYEIGFGYLSSWTHVHARSLKRDAAERRADGIHIVPLGHPSHGIRVIGISLLCGILASVSRQADLDVDEGLDTLRRVLVDSQS